MASTKDPHGSTAVGYFVAAVFVLTLPNLLFPEVHLALRVAFLAAGLAFMAVGFVQLRRETAARNRRADGGGSDPGDE
ncbi:hypothetical protein MHY30_04725 [Microbacterium sp. ACRRU]|jgi:VIT1/CCC1 family predicted Fe2+/Mn2+ transporter|uniref:hypothetical protein n=1 Tax=Microbacterium TaxID=33882 RepID=UPI001EF4F9C9|nr:hypothetical protein [Microbacterium sp. ACRRU]MCG7416807.1 hypothetical protein [Microbacterium sp. ACRRU]